MSATTDLRPRSEVTLAELTFAWLGQYVSSKETYGAYQRDLRQYLGYLATKSLDALAVTRLKADGYQMWLTLEPGRGGKPLASASVSRKLSAVSSWYDYLVANDALPANPFRGVRRPRVDKDVSKTVGLDKDEATRIREAAVSDPVFVPATAVALAGLLVSLGLRVSEICALDVTDLGWDSGFHTVTVAMKGGKCRIRRVADELAALLDMMLDGRQVGPLFVTRDGGRMDRHHVNRFVKRVAKAAGLANWERISPHSFRHAWNTIARLLGAALEDRQFALGHADPRTTQRYDRARLALARDPSYLVAVATTVVR